MKNWLQAVMVCVMILSFLSLPTASAQAASPYFDKQFAALAKKGQLKGVKGNIGMTYAVLKKQVKGTTTDVEGGCVHQVPRTLYWFGGEYCDELKPTQKVQLISKDLANHYSAAQLQKSLGKPIAKNTFKVGSYYIYLLSREKFPSTVYIGTKDGINFIRGFYMEDMIE